MGEIESTAAGIPADGGHGAGETGVNGSDPDGPAVDCAVGTVASSSLGSKD
jgi:hypothetical protein